MTTYRIILPEDTVLDFYEGAVIEYSKRLNRYCNVEVVYCNENQNLKSLMDGFYSIKVTKKGDSINSVDFSNFLKDLSVKGYSKIAFVLNLKSTAFDASLSLTSLDLSHGLELTCLLEQLYRGYKILQNEPYHK